MLRIYPVSVQVAREPRPLVDRIARFDRAASVQLRKSLGSVVNNLAEGSCLRAGRRRLADEIALGEAREALANLEFSEAMGYSPPVTPALRARFHHIIGTLVKIVHHPQTHTRPVTADPQPGEHRDRHSAHPRGLMIQHNPGTPASTVEFSGGNSAGGRGSGGASGRGGARRRVRH